MSKKVAFLGGCFQAEYSMRKSFMAAGVECFYLYDHTNGNYASLNNETFNNYDQSFIHFVTEGELQGWLGNIRPDIVIHRFYKDNPIMHNNAFQAAQFHKIPYCKILMETDAFDTSGLYGRVNNCDFFLYVHDTAEMVNVSKTCGRNGYFYAYGVGVNEFSTKAQKNIEVAGFGYPRLGHAFTALRTQNLSMYVEGLRKIGKKLNVFNSQIMPWASTPFANDLIINPFFRLEQENDIINSCKIIINFETCHNIENFYSYKIWQAVGRGVPVITYRKKCLEKMFGDSLIYVENSDEVAYWVDFLLKNDKFRNELGDRCEKFVHEKFDWYKRFNEIMIKQGIWAAE